MKVQKTRNINRKMNISRRRQERANRVITLIVWTSTRNMVWMLLMLLLMMMS